MNLRPPARAGRVLSLRVVWLLGAAALVIRPASALAVAPVSARGTTPIRAPIRDRLSAPVNAPPIAPVSAPASAPFGASASATAGFRGSLHAVATVSVVIRASARLSGTSDFVFRATLSEAGAALRERVPPKGAIGSLLPDPEHPSAPATFRVPDASGHAFSLVLPARVELTGSRGGVIAVDHFRDAIANDGPGGAPLGRIGARVHAVGKPVPGTYRGSFLVVVAYE